MTAALVSVVIPCYNGAAYVARAVESALAQSYPAVEVLVVDDGSTDNTSEVAAGFGSAITLIRHSKNAGLSAARNTAINSAKGRFIALLDSDDWWDKDKLAQQIALMTDHHDVDVVFSDFRGISTQGEPFGWQGGLRSALTARGLSLLPLSPHGLRVGGPVVRDLFENTSFIHPSTFLARRELLLRIGLFDQSTSPAEDLDMWLRLAAAGAQFAFVERLLVNVEARPESLGRSRIKMLLGTAQIYSQPGRYGVQGSRALRRFARLKCCETHRDLGWWYRQEGQRWKSASHYLQSLGYGFGLRTLLGLLKTLVTFPRMA